jgi:hypothetical protein
MTLMALVPFLVFVLIVLVVAYVLNYALSQVPNAPPPGVAIARLIIGLVAFILIATKALALIGVAL